MKTQMWGLAILTGWIGLGGCDPFGEEACVLPEGDGVRVIEEVLVEKGYNFDGMLTVENVPVCPPDTACADQITVVLDGWDPEAKFGFEYVSVEDPDFVGAREQLVDVGRVGAFREGRVQTAVNSQMAEGTVLVIRRWSHETCGLAETQLRSYVGTKLEQAGL